MQPRITVITVGVDDLERSVRFYRDGLGFKTDGIVGEEFDNGAVVRCPTGCRRFDDGSAPRTDRSAGVLPALISSARFSCQE